MCVKERGGVWERESVCLRERVCVRVCVPGVAVVRLLDTFIHVVHNLTCRGTSLIRNSAPLGPYSKNMPTAQ